MQSGLVYMIGECLYCKQSFRKREEKRKFCSLRCASNFNKNGLKEVVLPSHGSEFAEFIGICLGDGCISGYQVSVTLNKHADSDYIPYVYDLMKKLFPGVRVSLIEKVKDHAIDVRLYSKTVVTFLQEMGIVSNRKKIPAWIYEKESYKKACVRGLFDTEGSISFKKYKSKRGELYYKQLNFRNTNTEYMKLVRDVLLHLGLKPTMTLKKSLYISNQMAIDTFRHEIGFSNPKLSNKSIILKP